MMAIHVSSLHHFLYFCLIIINDQLSEVSASGNYVYIDLITLNIKSDLTAHSCREYSLLPLPKDVLSGNWPQQKSRVIRPGYIFPILVCLCPLHPQLSVLGWHEWNPMWSSVHLKAGLVYSETLFCALRLERAVIWVTIDFLSNRSGNSLWSTRSFHLKNFYLVHAPFWETVMCISEVLKPAHLCQFLLLTCISMISCIAL